MALKSTLSYRLFADLDIIFNQPLEKFIFQWNDTNSSLSKYFEERYNYNRLTMHPTEGRFLESIKLQYYLERSCFLFTKAAKLNKKRKANSYDCIELMLIAQRSGLDMQQFPSLESMISSFENFQIAFEQLVDQVIGKFLNTPLGHPKKMSKDEEIDLLLFWGRKLRNKKAQILTRIDNRISNYQLLKPSFLDDTTWAGDRDGKKEIDAFHYCKFELESQKAFFSEVLTKLDSMRQSLIHHEKNPIQLDEVISYIKSFYEENLKPNPRIFCYEESQKIEKQIISKLTEIGTSGDRDLSRELQTLMYFIEGCNLKIFKIGFTSREEPINVHLAVKNLIEIYARKKNITEKEYDQHLHEFITNTGKIVEKLSQVQTFENELEEDTIRQLCCQIASKRFHNQHEHIISCFDNQIKTYQETIAIDKLAAYFTIFHEKFNILKSLFKDSNLNFYETIFSSSGIHDIQKSKTFINTLPEQINDVKGLCDFYEKVLSKDEIIKQYLQTVGEVKITISKSDGSESMGSYLEPYLTTNNLVKLEQLCKVNKLNFRVLYGVGANDVERLAYHDTESIKPEQTLQGSNIPNFVNFKRIVKTLLRTKPDYNKEKITEYLKNDLNKVFIDNYCSFMYKQHLKNYFGINAKHQDFTYYSGRTIFRGPILMDIQSIMGRASARGETRTGNVKVLQTTSNTPTDFKDLDRKLRRIGEVNTNRIAAMAPFLFENYLNDVCQIFPEYQIKELHKIPTFRDCLFNALHGVAFADPEVCLMHNGLWGKHALENNQIIKYANQFEQNYEDQIESKDKNNYPFLDPENLRKLHISHFLFRLKKVIRNTFGVILIDAEEFTKKLVNNICTEIEQIPYNQYGDLLYKVSDACLMASEDKNIDKNYINRLKVMSTSLKQKEIACKIRKYLIVQLNQTLIDKDYQKYKTLIEHYAVLIRGSGNPFGKGGKHDSDLQEFYSCFDQYQDKILVNSLILKYAEHSVFVNNQKQ